MRKDQCRQVECQGATIEYRLVRKPIKNINLRIRQELAVVVSANERVPLARVDAFVSAKGPWILKTLERLRSRPVMPALPANPSAAEKRACRMRFQRALERLLPHFTAFGVDMPELKIRTMKSRWGSCAYQKGTITLNSRLMHTPEECLEYVVAHELAHFIHPDHSPSFYGLLSRVMPDHRERKKRLESQGRIL